MVIDERVSGNTKIIGIIGDPVEHTKSPFLHNTLSNVLGDGFIYVPFLVKQDNLKKAIDGIRSLNIVGINVTYPYKNSVINYLDELSKEVELIGSVNTIKFIDNKLIGYNTDGEGFLKSFVESMGTDFTNKTVTILGAGGATKSIAVKIALNSAKKIFIINRTFENAHYIADKINKYLNIRLAEAIESNDSKISEYIYKSDIIINTTSVGMSPNINLSPISEDICFSENQVVYDIIYSPENTKLLKKAKESNCKIENGIGMLFYQGIEAYKIWSERNFVDNSILKQLLEEFKKIK